MAGSSFGKLFKVHTFGESHGAAIGAVIEGCPAGLKLNTSDIQVFLDRRRPGQSRFTTPRVEADECKILSGIFEGKTTGTPIMVLVENTSQRSYDYDEISLYFRPGHADHTWDAKYGFRDYRGGGRSSGRETTGRVIAGAIASKVLELFGVKVEAFTQSIGPVYAKRFEMDERFENPFYMPDNQAAHLAAAYASELIEQKDSSGGLIGCIATGVPAGLGEPVFDKLDARLSAAIMSIGATKGIEFGSGFAAAGMKGSEHNDEFYVAHNKDGNPYLAKRSNNAGGISGGISDGSPIIISTAVKPTSSIARPQKTVNTDLEEIDIEVKGRHDPLIVPRAVVVVESMVAITLLDMMLENMGAKLENLEKIYKHGPQADTDNP